MVFLPEGTESYGIHDPKLRTRFFSGCEIRLDFGFKIQGFLYGHIRGMTLPQLKIQAQIAGFLTDSSLQQNPFKVPGLLGKEEHESPELKESSSCLVVFRVQS